MPPSAGAKSGSAVKRNAQKWKALSFKHKYCRLNSDDFCKHERTKKGEDGITAFPFFPADLTGSGRFLLDLVLNHFMHDWC